MLFPQRRRAGVLPLLGRLDAAQPDRRIELLFPILDKRLHPQLADFLQLQLADNVKARLLKPDGSSARVPFAKGQPRIRSQERLLTAAQSLAQSGQWGNIKVEPPPPEAPPAPRADTSAAS